MTIEEKRKKNSLRLLQAFRRPSQYILYIYFGKVGGGEVREKVERQQNTSIVPSSMGATVHKLG